MKQKKKQKKLRITEADYMLANRRAARLEEIAEHGVQFALLGLQQCFPLIVSHIIIHYI